jgi:hypothetical protein
LLLNKHNLQLSMPRLSYVFCVGCQYSGLLSQSLPQQQQQETLLAVLLLLLVLAACQRAMSLLWSTSPSRHWMNCCKNSSSSNS